MINIKNYFYWNVSRYVFYLLSRYRREKIAVYMYSLYRKCLLEDQEVYINMIDFISKVLTIMIISGFFAYGFFSLYKMICTFISKKKVDNIVSETLEEVKKE